MKKSQIKKLSLKTATVSQLASASGGDGDTYLPEVCLTRDLTKQIYSVIMISNCCAPAPSDANGNCRTYA